MPRQAGPRSSCQTLGVRRTSEARKKIPYRIYGLFTGEMYLPAGRGSITLQSACAFVLAAAFLCGAAHLGISLLGYPGRPDTTAFHEAFSKYTKYAAVALFLGALLAS